MWNPARRREQKRGLQALTEPELLWTHESCSLSRSVSTSLTPRKGSIHLCCIRILRRCPLRTLLMCPSCFALPAPVAELDSAAKPVPRVPLVLASCQRNRSVCRRVCYFSLNSFSGNSIKQVTGPYLTDFKKLLLNVESLFKHDVMSGVRWVFIHEGVFVKSLFP